MPVDGRPNRLDVRLTDDEHEAAKAKARREGMNVSEYIRWMLTWDNPRNPSRRIDDVEARVQQLVDRVTLIERMEARIQQLEQLAERSTW